MGFIDKALILDWEASGLIREIGDQTWDQGPQGIELGALIVHDLMGECKVVAEFTSRIRFIPDQFPKLLWDPEAEKIHGIRRRDLTSAAHPCTVAANFLQFLHTGWSSTEPILLGGQNPMYDRYFLNQLFRMTGQRVPRLHSRMIDTFSIGLAVWGHQTGPELFEYVSGTQRGYHTALGDARLSFEALKLAIQQTSRNKIGNREHLVGLPA